MGLCRFVYLRRAAALLELALCNYALQKATAKGFLPMTTPDLVRESVLVKCGFQPRGDTTQVPNEALFNLAKSHFKKVISSTIKGMQCLLDSYQFSGS